MTTEDANPVTRLLPGEDPASSLSEDLEHWHAVYDELVRAVEGLIERMSVSRIRLTVPGPAYDAGETSGSYHLP